MNNSNLRKTILSASVIILFVAYAMYQRLWGRSLPLPVGDNNTVRPLALNLPPSVNNQNNSIQPSIPAPVVPVKIPSQPAPAPTSKPTTSVYKNGSFTGNSADALYGNVQVQATIQNGKITNVQFLDYPQDRGNSIRINTVAMPILTSEAIQAQSAQVDIVSGATETSLAFQESLKSALAQASQ